jgi:hypothetical protein
VHVIQSQNAAPVARDRRQELEQSLAHDDHRIDDMGTAAGPCGQAGSTLASTDRNGAIRSSAASRGGAARARASTNVRNATCRHRVAAQHHGTR